MIRYLIPEISFIIDIGILNIIYKFATRKIHHSVNWICLSLSVPLRIFPPFNPSHFPPSPSLPSSPYLPLIYRESYPSFHKTFYTHFDQLYRADDHAAALIKREKAARYSPFERVYTIFTCVIAKTVPPEDHHLPFAIFDETFASCRKFPNYALPSRFEPRPKMANVYQAMVGRPNYNKLLSPA